MQDYKINPEGIKKLPRRVMLLSLLFTLFSLFAGFFISFNNSKNADFSAMLFIIPFIAIVLAFSFFRNSRRQKASLESYTLSVTNNLITRRLLNVPEISIYFNDIKEIVKTRKGSFTIKGKNPEDIIGIPAQINDHAELEKKLNEIHPVIVKPASLLQKLAWLFLVAVVGLMICVWMVENKFIVLISGVLLIAVLIWSLYKTQTSKNVDLRTKRSSWLILFVIISVLGLIIVKFLGIKKG